MPGGASSACRNVSLAIPDNNATGVTDNQTIATMGALTDLNVSVQATHNWVGDLVFTLQNVGTGTSVIVIDRPGVPASTFGCGGNNINATLDDEATTAVEGQCAGSTPAINGTFQPNNPLSAFDGQPLAATWRMTVADRANGDTGTLTQWCLIAAYGSALTADYSDSAASYGVAWHTGGGSLRLGSQWTADSSFSANGDTASDDGVTFVGAFGAGQPATVRVNVQGTPAAGRWLRLWFDWDGDGAFASAERVYDAAVLGGDNDLTVSVPASATTAAPYRARLYDSAAAPAGLAAAAGLAADSGSYGAASGGEVEDGLAPCAVPARVSGVTIARVTSSQLEIVWTPATGADRYEVWRAINAPYFTPGADCAAPGVYGCASVTGTSYPHAGLGDPASNYSYLVRGVSSCGAVSTGPYPRAANSTSASCPARHDGKAGRLDHKGAKAGITLTPFPPRARVFSSHHLDWVKLWKPSL